MHANPFRIPNCNRRTFIGFTATMYSLQVDRQDPDCSMARSLKTNYLLIALAVAAVLAVLMGGLAYYEHRVNTSEANQLTYTTVAESLEADLEARASSLAKLTAASLAPLLGGNGNAPAIAAVAEKLLDEHDIARVAVLDSKDRVVFSGSSSGRAHDGKDSLYFLPTDVRPQGALTTAKVGTLQIWMSRAQLQSTLASIDAQLLHKQGVQGRRIRGFLAGVTLPLLVLGLLAAWFVARQLARPIAALVKSADRIGEGDYTRPLEVVRQDELGDLQFSLERMRQKLNETTITKNYLDTVLNSLSDAVLVTSPDGVVKSCNDAAKLLLGFAEADIVGKPFTVFIDEQHLANFSSAQLAGGEGRETVFRTASGQTLPVSIASSAISTDDPQFQGIIYVARNITERKRAERRIRYLARYDTLTKMPNRMQFQHMLQQAIARCPQEQPLGGAAVPGSGPLQGSERHLRPRGRRPHA